MYVSQHSGEKAEVFVLDHDNIKAADDINKVFEETMDPFRPKESKNHTAEEEIKHIFKTDYKYEAQENK